MWRTKEEDAEHENKNGDKQEIGDETGNENRCEEKHDETTEDEDAKENEEEKGLHEASDEAEEEDPATLNSVSSLATVAYCVFFYTRSDKRDPARHSEAVRTSH